MRLEVFGEKEGEKEQVLRLRLTKVGSFVQLEAVDSLGELVNSGILMWFYESGKTHLCSGVSNKLGLKLKDGRLDVE